MGACISQDELDKSVGKFGIRNSSVGNKNDVPQLYCGYIFMANQKLTGPSSGIDCVYYETKATTKSTPLNMEQKTMTKYHSLETKQVDFIISDNPNNPLSSWIYVPVSFFAVKVNGAKQYQMKLNNPETAVVPNNVEDLMNRASSGGGGVGGGGGNTDEDPHSLTWSLNNKQLVFSDEVLEVGQQVAILGIIKEITLSSGDTARVLTPVTTVNMTDAFYRQNSWSNADKDRFNDITGNTPTFLISGKNQHFSGVNTSSPRSTITSGINSITHNFSSSSGGNSSSNFFSSNGGGGNSFTGGASVSAASHKTSNKISHKKAPIFPYLDEVRTNYRNRYLPFYVDPFDATQLPQASSSSMSRTHSQNQSQGRGGLGVGPERGQSDFDLFQVSSEVPSSFPLHHRRGSAGGSGGGGFVPSNRLNQNYNTRNNTQHNAATTTTATATAEANTVNTTHSGSSSNNHHPLNNNNHGLMMLSDGQSERTVDIQYKPLPREHRDNQQDFEDTVRTRN